MPYPVCVVDFPLRADRDLDREKMRDPALQHTTERIERPPATVQAHRKVEALIPAPIGRGIVLRQHIQFDGSRRRALLREELAQAAETAGRRIHVDGLQIGGHHRAVGKDAHPLRSEEHFRRPRLEGVGGLAEHVAQHHLRELLHEQRGHVDALSVEQRGVRRFEIRRGKQTIAEAQPDAVVVPGVRIGDRRDLRLGHRPARLCKQPLVQRALGSARLRHRRELGSQQRISEKRVAQQESALARCSQQAVAAGRPEVGHRLER